MKAVYLAGAITGLNWGGATEWREHAKNRLAQNGILGLSPMRAKEFLKNVDSFSATCEGEGAMDPLATPRGIMTRDRFDVNRCDVLLVNLLGSKSVSIGTMFEMAWADSKRTPIVCAMEDSGNVHEHAFVRESIAYKVPSLDEAIDIVISIIG